jgi:hypothetical protein
MVQFNRRPNFQNVLLFGLLINGTGDNMPHKQAKNATNKLKAHQNDANASFAHRTGDPEKIRMRATSISK